MVIVRGRFWATVGLHDSHETKRFCALSRSEMQFLAFCCTLDYKMRAGLPCVGPGSGLGPGHAAKSYLGHFTGEIWGLASFEQGLGRSKVPSQLETQHAVSVKPGAGANITGYEWLPSVSQFCRDGTSRSNEVIINMTS